MFTAAMFIFSSVRFLNICKPRTGWPTSTDILWSELACLPTWLAIMNTGWAGSIRSEVFLQMKFIIFKAVSSKMLSFYLGSPLHVISSLFSQFCLLQNAILHKMLRSGFWNCKSFFSEFSFHWLQHFFSVVLAICLSWYLHLALRHEFLTFISFNMWRWNFNQYLGLHIRNYLPDTLGASHKRKNMFFNFWTLLIKMYIFAVVAFFSCLVLIQWTQFFSGSTYLHIHKIHVFDEAFFLLFIRIPMTIKLFRVVSCCRELHSISTEWSCGITSQIKYISPPAEDVSTPH